MREISLRELARGRPGADRIALLSIWFHGHNNPRYAELLPRLDRLDACLLRLPDSRIPRGLGFRAFSVTKPLLLTGVLGRADSRYPNLLSLDFDQLPRWHGAAVMDADDPTFSPREIRQMQSPAVRAYVVTAETAARRYESLGVSKPWIVIPQGVNLAAATPELRAAAAARKQAGEVVLGWMAAHLLTEGDTGADNPLYNVDHLLELWEEIRLRVPHARLWLVGGPSERLRPVWPAATMCCSWAVCRVTRRSPPRPRSTSRRTPARPTRASGPRRCPSSSASASRRCHTTTR